MSTAKGHNNFQPFARCIKCGRKLGKNQVFGCSKHNRIQQYDKGLKKLIIKTLAFRKSIEDAHRLELLSRSRL